MYMSGLLCWVHPYQKNTRGSYHSSQQPLDPDALPKTIQFTKELRGYVDTVVAFKLTNDLKYRHPNDIEKLTTLGVKYGININT